MAGPKHPYESDTLLDQAGDDEAATIQRISAAEPAPSQASDRTEISGPPQSSSPRAVNAEPAPLDDTGFVERYQLGTRLGIGGMGEVRLVRDHRIGRDVAMKLIREGVGMRGDVRIRFEREARVQGQLEHPSIVPVYDLGISPGGEAFFTMKRVRGHSLDDIMRGLRKNQPEFTERYGLRKLLTSYRQMCLAVAFAHSRGVIHRDIKPANIMMGDFGEVYLLDWGLAKIAGTEDLPEDSAIVSAPSSAGEGETVRGAIVGTPGYIPPEQVRSAAMELDHRADIYALGAILFEVLTWQPLQSRVGTTPEKMLVDALAGVNARARKRAPEKNIAPELEAICVKATAFDPEDRYASVEQMIDAIERYLDGDRDSARRKELAATHAEAAGLAMDRARLPGKQGDKARAEAIREVNRALALDPTHPVAQSIMLRLLLEPPSEVPKEMEEELASSLRNDRRITARVGGFAYVSWFGSATLMVWQGIKDWWVFGIVAGLVFVSALFSWLLAAKEKRHTIGMVAVTVTSTAAIGLSSQHFGPFILIPGLAAANTLVFAMNARKGWARNLTIAIGSLGVIVPVLLERIGIVKQSWAFTDDHMKMIVDARMTYFNEPATLFMLVVSSVFMIIIPALVVGRLRDEAVDANRRVLLHMWHLRQFIPDQARKASQLPATTPAE